MQELNYRNYQVTKNLNEIIRFGLSRFQRKTKRKVSEFAEQTRVLSKDESARPGQWDNSIVPFAVEPMDEFVNPEIEKITFMGSAQVVKTEILKNIIKYIVEEDPAPAMIVYPTDGDARDFSSEKLEPMIDANLSMQKQIAPQKSNSKDNKTLFKKFIGGFIAIVGGRVPQDLARRSIKYLLVDDADRVGNAGNEGDAVSLAWERTESYAKLGRKLIQFSTPTVKGGSRIRSDYEKSDKRQYYIPCPFCSSLQTLKFEQLKWEKDTDLTGKTIKHYPETVYYECEECKEKIDESYKPFFLDPQNGACWIAENPEIKDHAGFWINRLYSNFSTWENIVKLFLKVKSIPSEYQVFVNTTLARTYNVDRGEGLDESGLIERCEDYLSETNPFIPKEVLVLTAGVDTQPDRLEFVIAGFGLQDEPFHIFNAALYGDTDQENVWNDLEEALNQTFTREDGVKMKINFRPGYDFPILVDSGGKNTQSVYRQCQKRFRKGFMALKGQGGMSKPILLNVSKVGPQKNILLQNVGVDAVKTMILKMLKINNSPNKIHFNKQCDRDYFEQLTAERVIPVINKKNFKEFVWKKKSEHARNEVLDIWVYAIAAFRKLNPNLLLIEKKLNEAAAQIKAANEAPDLLSKEEPKKQILKRNKRRSQPRRAI